MLAICDGDRRGSHVVERTKVATNADLPKEDRQADRRGRHDELGERDSTQRCVDVGQRLGQDQQPPVVKRSDLHPETGTRRDGSGDEEPCGSVGQR